MVADKFGLTLLPLVISALENDSAAVPSPGKKFICFLRHKTHMVRKQCCSLLYIPQPCLNLHHGIISVVVHKKHRDHMSPVEA